MVECTTAPPRLGARQQASRAIEEGNEADKTPELKMLRNGLGVISVRFAALSPPLGRLLE